MIRARFVLVLGVLAALATLGGCFPFSGLSQQQQQQQFKSDPVYSPDGSEVAFMSNVDGDLEVFVVDADGTDLRQLTENDRFDDFSPAWSPDGRRIVFASNRSGQYEIYTMAADGSDVELLTTAGGSPQ